MKLLNNTITLGILSMTFSAVAQIPSFDCPGQVDRTYQSSEAFKIAFDRYLRDQTAYNEFFVNGRWKQLHNAYYSCKETCEAFGDSFSVFECHQIFRDTVTYIQR